MGRFPQPTGARGSLKWIQQAVNDPARSIDGPILARLPHASRIEWLSPLATDDHAEYRDGAFLDRIGASHLAAALNAFWPARGPQWDALARTDAGDVLLVEAKAHIGELCSPRSKASEASLGRIISALDATAASLGAKPLAAWNVAFYQLANRLAHLHFLRSQSLPAWLVLVNFVGDDEMDGPSSEEVWRAAYDMAGHVMGLPQRHLLSAHMIEIFPDLAA